MFFSLLSLDQVDVTVAGPSLSIDDAIIDCGLVAVGGTSSYRLMFSNPSDVCFLSVLSFLLSVYVCARTCVCLRLCVSVCVGGCTCVLLAILFSFFLLFVATCCVAI